MQIQVHKDVQSYGKKEWHYLFSINQEVVGHCDVEVMDGQQEDVLQYYDTVDTHNCYDLLLRIQEVAPFQLNQTIAFIRYFEIEETYQRKGIGRCAFSLIQQDLLRHAYQLIILDAFKGGFLLPFYASFGFTPIPFPIHIPPEAQTPHNGQYFRWYQHAHFS